MKTKSVLTVMALLAIIVTILLTMASCKKKAEDPPPTNTVPAVTTISIANITETTATGGGNVNLQGSSSVTVRGVCWSMSSNPTIADPYTIDGYETGSFTSYLTGLTANTPYYVRAYATNSTGTAYGNQVSFTTTPSGVVLTVTTTVITNITETSATGGGNVAYTSSSAVTAKGVCWSTSANPTISDPHTSDGLGTGSFNSFIYGLTSNTPYYVRAYATISTGTTYGTQVSFNTTGGGAGEPCPGMPTITDSRDGKTYTTVQIGNQCWMAQNMNIGTRISGYSSQINNSIIEKYCYNDNENNCNIYGGLYQWDEAMQYSTTPGIQGICPAGWHLPTDAEWTTLSTFLGGEGLAGGKMKSTGTIQTGGLWNGYNIGATNSSGFTAIPGGIRMLSRSYGGLTSHTYFWSSSLAGAEAFVWGRTLSYNHDRLDRGRNGITWGFTARCVMD